jgi:hypothetical protein
MQQSRKILPQLLTLFLGLLFLSSCKVDQAALEKAAGEAGFTLNNNTLSIIGGNNQSVVQNAAAPTALSVIVRDQDGLAKAGEDVQFEIMTTDGGLLDSSVTQKSVTTGSNGRASVTYTAGTSLGEVVISATIAGSSVTFTQTVTDASSATATITAKAITVTGTTATGKTYDAGLTATIVTTSSAITNGAATSSDNKYYSTDTVALEKTGASGSYATKTVGIGKAVTVTGFTLSGADAGNYTVTEDRKSTRLNSSHSHCVQ